MTSKASGYRSTALEVRVHCPTCDAHLPLFGLGLGAGCPACRTRVEASRAFWREILRATLAAATSLRHGERGKASFGREVRVTVLYAASDPRCTRCHHPLRVRGLDDARLAGEIACVCGTRIPVRSRMNWLRDVIGERALFVAEGPLGGPFYIVEREPPKEHTAELDLGDLIPVSRTVAFADSTP
jgi:DNA-directed RNA polymerase subunit RPC12/RpoP